MCLLVALTYVKYCSRATRAEQAKHVNIESLQDLDKQVQATIKQHLC